MRPVGGLIRIGCHGSMCVCVCLCAQTTRELVKKNAMKLLTLTATGVTISIVRAKVPCTWRPPSWVDVTTKRCAFQEKVQ